MSNWPPDGYSEPQPWPGSQAVSIVIGVVVSVPLFSLFRDQLSPLADPVIAILPEISEQLGYGTSPIWLAGTVVLLYLGGVLAVLGIVVIPFHEWLHFKLDELMGLSPKFVWVDTPLIPSPGVLAVDTGSTRAQRAPSALGPFLIIGFASAIGALSFDGWLGGMCALILVLNSASSGTDIYNLLFMLSKPRETRYRGYLDGDGVPQGEYAIPRSRNSQGPARES